ncbi:capsular polysaccharide export protein, LipB/KpsS family [Methylolobus aquaticus]
MSPSPALTAERSDLGASIRPISICHGFTLWRRVIVRSLLAAFDSRAQFTGHGEDPVPRARSREAGIVVWASEEPPGLARQCSEEGVPLLRMEDGFIRSGGLGSDFSWPYSMVLDRGGIYFDPESDSDLEQILENTDFDASMLQRAARLRQRVVSDRVTKYQQGGEAPALGQLPSDRKRILVPGQVPQDASVVRGGGEIRSNLALLAAVRRANPEAYVLYKPHPDVARGNRNGAVHPDDLLRLADREVTGVPIASLFAQVDEVHTLTSLAGFEALLRDKPVHTYGRPFYAGWGLTRDRYDFPRRSRQLTVDELVAGSLIAYPLYFDWARGDLQTVESALDQLAAARLPLPLRLRSRLFFTGRALLKATGLMNVLRRCKGKADEIPRVERNGAQRGEE